MAGVAWSLPVIATAIAAPAAAASALPASAKLGAAAPVTIAGASSASGPTSFDVQTGTSFTGTSVSYTITIESQLKSQKALIGIATATPGTGSSTVSQNKQSTTFAGSFPAQPGNHAFHVSLAGYNYTDTATKGQFRYTVTLTVTIAGSQTIVATSELLVTF